MIPQILNDPDLKITQSRQPRDGRGLRTIFIHGCAPGAWDTDKKGRFT
jgi:hypothetical protein